MNESNREKKQAWKLQQKREAQSLFPLDESALEQLFEHLDRNLENAPCDHTIQHTLAWISAQRVEEEPLLEWARDNGGYCDCEILANTGEHFDENRSTD